jgi:quercetin dioxygenase-like cupin family protein
MEDFPEFMRRAGNRIPVDQQNTPDVEGYVYEGADGSQMAFWTSHAERASAPHRHDFDEYMVVVSGQYVTFVDGQEHVLGPGDELFIPKGSLQSGWCAAGTRTIHAFGGQRIRRP